MEKNYKEEYNQFVSNYKKGMTDGEDVGILVVKMAQYFADFNTKAGQLEIMFNAKAAEIEGSSDPASGKPISSTKAKVMAEATDEYFAYLMVKRDRENVEQYLNALKSLQRGVLNEYQHTSNI